MRPGDIAVGVRDLLSILVPGALLLLLVPDDIAVRIIGGTIVAGETLQEATLFLAAAYAIGALISAVGGWFDPLAEAMYRPINAFWPGTSQQRNDNQAQFNSLRDTARELERRLLERSSIVLGDKALWGDKTFWRNYLRVACPAAITELDRTEGQQKLFRSLSLVFLLAATLYSYTLFGMVLLVTAVLSFLLFVAIRRQFTVRLFQLGIAYFAFQNGEIDSP